MALACAKLRKYSQELYPPGLLPSLCCATTCLFLAFTFISEIEYVLCLSCVMSACLCVMSVCICVMSDRLCVMSVRLCAMSVCVCVMPLSVCVCVVYECSFRGQSRTFGISYHCLISTATDKNELRKGAEEMAQRLRALLAIPKVLSSIPSNHMVVHNHL